METNFETLAEMKANIMKKIKEKGFQRRRENKTVSQNCDKL